MVNDLLDAAKLETSGMAIEMEPVACDEAIRQVVQRMTPLAQQKGLKLGACAPGRLLCWADPVRLGQVLTNLVANAIKFSTSGTIEVHATEANGVPTVEVRDEGSGWVPSILTPSSMHTIQAQTDRGAAIPAGSDGRLADRSSRRWTAPSWRPRQDPERGRPYRSRFGHLTAKRTVHEKPNWLSEARHHRCHIRYISSRAQSKPPAPSGDHQPAEGTIMTDAYAGKIRIYRAVIDRLNQPLQSIAFKTHPPERGMNVLDVGCGTGSQLVRYEAAGCSITGVDLSPAMLAEARTTLGKAADLHLADATNLPFDSVTFDLVLISMMLHELTPDTRIQVLAEMSRVLRSDGAVIVTDFTAGPLTLKGRFMRTLSWAFERLAGADHFGEFRTFVKAGGLPAVISGSRLRLDRERPLAGGNVAVYICRAV